MESVLHQLIDNALVEWSVSDQRQFSVAVTRWSRSTQLLYVEPG